MSHGEKVIFRHIETPSMRSMLLERMLWASGLKSSQEETRNFKRRDYSKSISSPNPPEYLKLRINIRKETVEGFPVFYLSPRAKPADKQPKTILYLHGGSYLFTFTRQHWGFLTRLVEATGSTIIAPDYPLAPKHSYAHAYLLLTALYELITADIDPGNLLFMGDSAGGGLALGFSMFLRDEGFPLPEKLVMLSPWLDITLTNPAIQEIDNQDPFLNVSALKKAGLAWAHGANPRKCLISPIYGRFDGLPELYLFIGTKDIMIADCRRLLGYCLASNVHLNYFEYENMLHVWMLLTFKEAKEAAAQIAEIVKGAGKPPVLPV